MNVVRYGQRFKERAVARLLPPESGTLEVVVREVGMGAGTLVRWREQIESRVSLVRAWTADARLGAVITTVTMDEVSKSAWFSEHGVFATDLGGRLATLTLSLDGSVVLRWEVRLGYWGPSQQIEEPERQPLNLDDHVTSKTLDGLFTEIGAQEQPIRQNPVARSTDLLKKGFGSR